MLKVNVEPIALRLLNNRTVHSDYLRLTQEQTVILRKVVEQGKSQNPLNNSLDHASKYTNRIQELLILIRQTCPSINNSTQSQEKDTVIRKLKERFKSLSGNVNKDKVKKDIEEIETINIKLDHRVSKLIAKNEHLKETYKKLYVSIKPTRVRSKEQSDALNNQVNLKSLEISDLNENLQEQGLIVAPLRDELRKLKGKAIVENAVITHTIDPEMLKVDVEPIAPRFSSKPAASTGLPSSITVDQDPPSLSNTQTTPKTQSLVNSNNVEEENHDLDVAHMNNDPFFGVEESPKTPTFHDDPLHESLHEDSTSQGSPLKMVQTYTPFESLGRWTKDHPIANVIGDPSRSASTRKQLQTDVMWCFYDGFLTLVEPKNFKQVMTELSWIDAMQEEIPEFEWLQV
uniref:Integrase, catalytic region, zinc finger, CCHC-type, peptidase aspartic, catalytic n=1 Tax=Tanacetum cinerariifolium TaxID=118510 RepID=A0A6L2J9N2_TANCI|nr:integrase, catalytic region, zinc finger, CCHC-type, peptidase aspartic, catalytic [Tanacetum cinerariifolium]